MLQSPAPARGFGRFPGLSPAGAPASPQVGRPGSVAASSFPISSWIHSLAGGGIALAALLGVGLFPCLMAGVWIARTLQLPATGVTLWVISGALMFALVATFLVVFRSARIGLFIYLALSGAVCTYAFYAHWVLFQHFPEQTLRLAFFRGSPEDVLARRGVVRQASGLGMTAQDIKEVYGEPQYYIDYQPDGLNYAWGNWRAFPDDNTIVQVSFMDLDGTGTLRACLLCYVRPSLEPLGPEALEKVQGLNGGDSPKTSQWTDMGNGLFIREDETILVGFVNEDRELQVEYNNGINGYSRAAFQALIDQAAHIKALPARLSVSR